jgi:UDP-N-acetylmuramoylalanine--D-glutamate ligase
MVGSENRRDFPEDLRGKRVIVLGAGRSGRAAAALLARYDAQITLVDDYATSVDPHGLEPIVASHVQIVLGNVRPELASNADAVVISPGVRLTHPLLLRAREIGLPVIGELELGSRYVRAPMVAVTGTNGKTTTVHWIAHLLNKGGCQTTACGNVGTAFCEVVSQTPDWFVVEVSSYQLETIERFHPRAAAILNLTPDHLDRHPTADTYLAAKARITANQRSGDALVLNADDGAVWSVAAKTAAAAWGFSLSRPLDRGVFVEHGKIVVREAQGSPACSLLGTHEISLPGSHNLANALATVAAAWVCGVAPEAIAAGLQDFAGVEHRIERVRERQGVRFVNDSKATNLASLEVALLSFDRPIILIAGGRGKGAPYEPLAPLIVSRVRRLIVLGEDAGRIEAAWGPHVPTQRVADMAEAVEQAAQLARPGEIVLLSPACASFDMYRNFEERGRHFKELVMRLEG